MNGAFSKKTIAAISIFTLLIIAGILFFFVLSKYKIPVPVAVEKVDLSPKKSVIGKSVQGREIEAFTFQNSTSTNINLKKIVFVGGIHGGYEWNSVLLAYKFISYLKANPNIIPKNISITVIPSANPDGLYKVTNKAGEFSVVDVNNNLPAGTGRFNANEVDLNRNFNCKWQATSTWRSKMVSAGSYAFSEPEAKALQNFVLQNKPTAVIFWHSQSNTVYASECLNGILPETLNIMDVYSKASGYALAKTFDSYAITGDAGDWLASINIPAITVELSTHETIEWEKNLAGIKSLLEHYK